MQVNTTYLRPLKAKRLTEIYRTYENRTGQLELYELNNVTISPLGQDPDVNRHDADILVDDCDFASSICHNNQDVYKQLNGKTLYGGYVREHYGHFLTDTVERLWPLFGNEQLGIDHILFFADSPKSMTPTGNFREFFEILGIWDKLVICDKPIAVEHLVVPDVSFEHPVYYSKEFLRVFEAIREKCFDKSEFHSSTNCCKIFMTRSQLPNAKNSSININELDKLFAANGFEIIAPEQLTLRELVTKIGNATTIASVSGTLAHNLLFCNPDAEFIIAERTAANNEYQVGINLIMGIEPTYIDCFMLPWPMASVDMLFLFSKTEELARFISDRGWTDAQAFIDSPRQRRRELRRFLRTKERSFAHSNRFLKWELNEAESIAEACCISEAYYEPWLSGIKPIRLRDVFTMIYLKGLIKRLLHR